MKRVPGGLFDARVPGAPTVFEIPPELAAHVRELGEFIEREMTALFAVRAGTAALAGW